MFLDFLFEIRKKGKKAGFELVGPRRGEGRFCALWSLAREEFLGLCVLVGSKSSFCVILCNFV